jgi:DNA uptake protein ComE-like DNA-binding protein
MSRILAFIFAALLAVPALAAENPQWETWNDCRFAAEKFFDGDSFHIQHGSEAAILRLYFVDAPETDEGYGGRIGEQAAYFHTSNAAVLRAGAAAKEFTAKFLAKPFRVITCRRVAPGASRSDRYYAMVERDGLRLDAALIEAGLARATSEIAAYPDAAAGQRVFQQLRVLEQKAAQAKRGLWAHTSLASQAVSLGEALKRRLGKDAAPPGVTRRTNVNTATQAELEALPGIGPKTAQQFIHARPIKDLEALDALPGIGPRKLEALRDLVSFQ